MPRPVAALRPFLDHGGHVHEKQHHLEAAACLLIAVRTDRLRVQNADQAGLFPRFLQGHLLGCPAGLQTTLRDYQALAAARRDQTNAAGP